MQMRTTLEGNSREELIAELESVLLELKYEFSQEHFETRTAIYPSSNTVVDLSKE